MKTPEEWAKECLSEMRYTDRVILDRITKFIGAAVEESKASNLPGVPLEGAVLATIRARMNRITIERDRATREAQIVISARQDLSALLAHLDYLEALFRDLASDGVLDHYRRGFVDGKKAGVEEERAAWMAQDDMNLGSADGGGQ